MNGLEALLRGQVNLHEPSPRPSPQETIRILHEAQAALDRPSKHFTRGMPLQIKPDLHSGMFKSENPVYVFERYLEKPINPLDYAEGIRECLSTEALDIRDCIVFGLDDESHVVIIAMPSNYFEEIK